MTGLETLPPAWRAAFGEAWASAQAGSYGVGAVLVDPASGEIVSRGRNRVAERPSQPGVIAGNMTAHAEMNAFASLDRFNAQGLHLYTTLEPCLMCAASAMLLKVEHVHLAVADEFFDDLDDLWAAHELTAARRPTRSVSFEIEGDSMAALGAFGRTLPMLFTITTFPQSSAAELARRRHPVLAEFCERRAASPDLRAEWLALELDDAVESFAAELGLD